jgi:hypothetical protein
MPVLPFFCQLLSVSLLSALQKLLDASNEQLRTLRLRYDGMANERDIALGIAQEAQKSEAQLQTELIRVRVRSC